MTPQEAEELIKRLTTQASLRSNEFTKQTLRTRGGRIGSGMGLLLEALWGYHVNEGLIEGGWPIEIGWIATHEYNDFACMDLDADWDPTTKHGEVLRVEIKSMVASADESKAHFDKTWLELGEHDLLVVLLWDWQQFDARRRYPAILDTFVGNARQVAFLRDKLHLARGGTFVEAQACPDACRPKQCSHVGEPLNASGKRERLSGPAAAKPAGVAYAANFGGLVRMLKTSGVAAAKILRNVRSEYDSAHDYINFVHRNLPHEETNQFSIAEWKLFAADHGVYPEADWGKRAIRDAVADEIPAYQDKLRTRFPG